MSFDQFIKNQGKLNRDSDHYYDLMKKAYERGALLACAIKVF
jgi:hypothetical protein